MLFNYVIFHRSDLNLQGKGKKREAVRAVIMQDGKITLAYLNNNEEYKFPGGGVKENESFEDALRREVNEEIGANIKNVGDKIGIITEYDRQDSDKEDYFEMISHYYLVEIENKIGNQNLDEYEKEYGFILQRTTIEEALKKNRETMAKENNRATKWIKRETYVLNELNNNYKKE